MHPQAAAELEAGFWRYEHESSGLGEDFRSEVEAGIVAIGTNPTRWPVFKGIVRRYLVHRFPYGLLYSVKGDAVRILAVMHLHRRPDYWRERR